MQKIIYEGFEIEALPFQLLNGKWDTGVQISLRHDTQENIRLFTGKGLFDTQQEAIRHALQLGRQIVDGKIPAYSVADL